MNALVVESSKIAGKTALKAGAYCCGAVVGTVGGFYVGNKVIEGTANTVRWISSKLKKQNA